MPPSPRRAAIYARVSTDRQREARSIETQVDVLERFAAEQGWQIIQVCRDDGVSGAM